jgi:hexosaminidase
MNKTAFVSALLLGACALGATAAVHVVPMPQKLTESSGAFVAPTLAVDTALDPSLPAEGYRIKVTPSKISVWHSTPAGEFYALQTLKQIADTKPDGTLSVPCVDIEDAPRFRWRGLHFDDCRHFFGKEALKKTLDAMAAYKLNTLHWHLTEDQGWRIEIKKYPLLVKNGAIRPGSPKRLKEHKPGLYNIDWTPYGPYFYTQEDVKEIVRYAEQRHIRIVPEIELPGHALAALAAYPWLGCTGRLLTPWWQWGVSKDIFCGGNDQTIAFLEDVFDEVCALFPSDVVHIGGDEAPKNRWKECPKCQKRIKDEGLDGEEGLQGWMTRHFTEYLAKKGKRAIGWDEILDGNPGTNTIVMSWRGPGGGIKAAARGNDAVMTPIEFCYIDRSPGVPGDTNDYINYFNKPLTIENVYAFNPTDGIPAEQQKHILGAHGNNWSEFTLTPAELEWKMWPRSFALAEVLWTYPDPARRDFAEFSIRAAEHRRRMIANHINCAPLK